MSCENLDGQCAKSWCNCEQVRARSLAPAACSAGDVFRNRYGLLLRVVRVEKRGVVRVLGSHGSWDIHEGLTEWADLSKNWEPNK